MEKDTHGLATKSTMLEHGMSEVTFGCNNSVSTMTVICRCACNSVTAGITLALHESHVFP